MNNVAKYDLLLQNTCQQVYFSGKTEDECHTALDLLLQATYPLFIEDHAENLREYINVRTEMFAIAAFYHNFLVD